jgi:dCMP deaminase
MNRPEKREYFLGIAEAIAARSTCIRRQYGAVIVKNDVIVATGYNGSPRHATNCCDEGACWRAANNIPHGERYEMCRSLHAEANAIIAASLNDMIGATLYMTCISAKDGSIMPGTSSCMMCKRHIINAGIAKVVIRDDEVNYRVIDVREWVEDDDSLSGQFGY